MIKWKLNQGRVYTSADGSYMIKNVGYKSWGLFVNDGSSDWDINWVGSVYPSVKAAQLAVQKQVAA
jgi:hypothetical protein